MHKFNSRNWTFHGLLIIIYYTHYSCLKVHKPTSLHNCYFVETKAKTAKTAKRYNSVISKDKTLSNDMRIA